MFAKIKPYLVIAVVVVVTLYAIYRWPKAKTLVTGAA